MRTQQVPDSEPGSAALGAINARPRTVVDYDTDPRNPAMQVFRDVLLRLHGFLVPAVLGGDADPETMFFGYGPELQDFKGAAAPGHNPVVYADPTGAEIGSAAVAGPSGDPARRIFADRLRRRSGL